MENRFTGEIIAVLNHKNKDPILINPENVSLIIHNYIFDHGRFIPKNYSLIIENEHLLLDVKMETLNTHFIKLPFIKYWRYHVRVTGVITFNHISEEINLIKISELIKFF